MRIISNSENHKAPKHHPNGQLERDHFWKWCPLHTQPRQKLYETRDVMTMTPLASIDRPRVTHDCFIDSQGEIENRRRQPIGPQFLSEFYDSIALLSRKTSSKLSSWASLVGS